MCHSPPAPSRPGSCPGWSTARAAPPRYRSWRGGGPRCRQPAQYGDCRLMPLSPEQALRPRTSASNHVTGRRSGLLDVGLMLGICLGWNPCFSALLGISAPPPRRTLLVRCLGRARAFRPGVVGARRGLPPRRGGRYMAACPLPRAIVLSLGASAAPPARSWPIVAEAWAGSSVNVLATAQHPRQPRRGAVRGGLRRGRRSPGTRNVSDDRWTRPDGRKGKRRRRTTRVHRRDGEGTCTWLGPPASPLNYARGGRGLAGARARRRR